MWARIIALLAAAAILVGLAAMLVFYFKAVDAIKARRWQRKSNLRIERSNIPAHTVVGLSHNFSSGEDTVYWADRQHQIVFWFTAGPLLVLAGLCLTAAAALESHSKLYRVRVGSDQPPHYLHLNPAWLLPLPLGLALLSLVVVWLSWLRWRAGFRIITNQHLRLDTEPWPWAWWLWNDEDHDPQPFTNIISPEKKATFWGTYLGFGTVRVKTYQMEDRDEQLHELRYVRDFRDFADLLSQLSHQARDHGVAELAPRAG